MPRSIGVALSGGGHRASAWGLGTLLYLADVGANRDVAAISSVSGGSITNGVLAHELDYRTADAAAVDAATVPLVRHVADTGLFFWGPSTNRYVLSVVGGLLAGVVALVTGVVIVCRDGLTWAAGVPLLAAAALLALTAWWAERRSDVVDSALAGAHYSTGGRPTRLADVGRSLDHVFCATELQSGGHFYFSPGFVYSYEFGVGEPAGLRLSTAVQASACLPGAFSPRRLPSAPHRFDPTTARDVRGLPRDPARDLLLTDGGVYDNMADQWPVGLADRVARLPGLPVQARSVEDVVVVNSSAPSGERMPRSRVLLVGELTTLLRVKSVMYQVGTERRRHANVRAWDAAARTGAGQRGALVQISQSPFTVADAFRDSAEWPERAARARAVLDLLGDTAENRAAWTARAEASSGVPTVLRALGRATTLDLLEHSYVLAMCNLHVLLGLPLTELPGRDRFARLLGDTGVQRRAERVRPSAA
ncbi:hypothetical protein SAMN05660748_3004 [Blastococcus aggregatus]|uniref:PNPLA domain-containing protein n=1 Tax=Blastococcus aggregatus TaxID=38502 RepID=A0A285V819_9ACTN|nr:patatin-like phospholipase family protein [Blastococcus aggregatus]SOC50262.1 hypothetical protein SAMN05660748_3004 [Blastococcus aggregatus]